VCEAENKTNRRNKGERERERGEKEQEMTELRAMTRCGAATTTTTVRSARGSMNASGSGNGCARWSKRSTNSGSLKMNGMSKSCRVMRNVKKECQAMMGANLSMCTTFATVSAASSNRCRSSTVRVQASIDSSMDASPTRTVAETKSAFMKSYTKPLGLLYSTAVNELLVQQHLLRFNVEYSYNPIFALGVVSVFDQLFSSLPERDQIFDAYVSALCEDTRKYRADAEALSTAAAQSKGTAISPITSESTDIQKKLIEAKASIGKQHTKFLAIGLFRVLELSEITDKEALASLVEDLGCDFAKVTKDLTMYKGMLSKMEGARELMNETSAREKKKDEERLANRKKQQEKKEEEEKTEASNPSASTA